MASARQSAAKKEGKVKKGERTSKSSVPLVALAGAVVAVLVACALALAWRSDDGRGATPQLNLTFVNPSSREVYLFVEHGSAEQHEPKSGSFVTAITPGASVDGVASVGDRFFFSRQKGGSDRLHIVDVDGSMTEYRLNPKCTDISGAALCLNLLGQGTCQTHPGWMSVHCAASCHACHLMDPNVRCDAQRLNLSMRNAVGSGGIDEMFSSLQRRFPQYDVDILSSGPEGLWVATLNNFITYDEALAVRDVTAKELKRSTDQGGIDPETGIQEKVVSKSRTSTNAWCTKDNHCSTHPLVKNLLDRIANVVQAPQANFEDMQVLRYEVGQFYGEHHDCSPQDFDKLSGPRLYTMFLYFDSVEEGGGTAFPKLNVTVKPQKGKALLWPSLSNSDPEQIDQRALHAALPVIRGAKLGANVWVHQRDFKTPNKWGCTGSFEDAK